MSVYTYIRVCIYIYIYIYQCINICRWQFVVGSMHQNPTGTPTLKINRIDYIQCRAHEDPWGAHKAPAAAVR